MDFAPRGVRRAAGRPPRQSDDPGARPLHHLQRAAGNAAVAQLLAVQRAPRQDIPGVLGPGDFGLTGFQDMLGLTLNGTKITWEFGRDRAKYRGFTFRQWQGPQSLYVAKPGETQWTQDTLTKATGSDDPDSQHQHVEQSKLWMEDSPGLQWGFLLSRFPGAKHMYAAQFFTSWVEATPVAGGPPERITDVVPWHSCVGVTFTGGAAKRWGTDVGETWGWPGLPGVPP